VEPVIARVRELAPAARLYAYGLYAPMNADWLRGLGVETTLGGEFEAGLVELVEGRDARAGIERLDFVVPDRAGLPSLERYAALRVRGENKVAGYTEASRGCKHRCRHCPIVPVYDGVFRVVRREVVLEDIRRQVEAGAQHITFGDPDFFNGTGHAIPLVRALHARHPLLTYDVTIKIEHLLRHRDLLPILRQTGCALVTSAAESIDDAVLERLAKGHTRADFFAAVRLMREAGLALAPTFVTFTPWTSRQGYRELLEAISELQLIDAVAPIQLAMRLLIPAGSRMLELEDVRRLVGDFNPAKLAYPWRHPDPGVDELCASLQTLIRREEPRGTSRTDIFAMIWKHAIGRPPDFGLVSRAAVPYLTEPWYC
ncbi:MAG: radical SAM protein, partial [Bryobacteraceae bacterium]